MTWDGRARQIMQQLITADATLIAAHGESGRWKFRLLAPERSVIAHVYEALENPACNPDFQSVTTVGTERTDITGMADKQHESLTTAFEMGYYDIPRAFTSGELTDELGICHQALSERFRRAHRELVKTTISAHK